MILARLLVLLLALPLTGIASMARADEPAAAGPDALSRVVSARAAETAAESPEAARARGQRLLEHMQNDWARQPIPPGGLMLPEALGAEIEAHIAAALSLARDSDPVRAAGDIGREDVERAFDALAPYATSREGAVTFFPELDDAQQVEVPAGQLEALRDSGLHWRLLQVALDSGPPARDLDPGDAEVLAEAVARYTILLLRLAGANRARLDDAPFLTPEHVHLAIREIRSLATLDAKESGSDSPGAAVGRHTAADRSSADGVTTEARRRAWYDAWGLSPDDPEVLQRYGGMIGGIGRFDEAIAIYEEALSVRPDYDYALWGIALVYWQKGDAENAARYLSQVAASDSVFAARSHTMLGNIAARQGRRDEALAHYEKSVELDPDRADAHMNLGIAYFRRERLAEALEQFDEALGLEPESMPALMYRAKIHDLDGDEDAAVVDLETMLALDPSHPRALFNLGQIQERHGRVPAAMEYYRRAHKNAVDRGERVLAGQISRAIEAR